MPNTMDVIPEIAQRYSVPEDAARAVYTSLVTTAGATAEWNHAALGGAGHWQPGVCTLGRGGDENLRKRVAGMAAEFAAIVRGTESAGRATLSRDSSTGASSGRSDLAAGESWWPGTFGHPAATGDECGVRYAFFPETKRLLIQVGGRIDAYDTGAHVITGCKENHDAKSKVHFTTSAGSPVRLSELQRIRL